MRILVAGGGFANKGAEAMLQTVSAELSSRLGPVEIILWRCPPSERPVVDLERFVPVSPPLVESKAGKMAWSMWESAASGHLTLRTLRDPALLWRERSAAWMLDRTGPFDALVDITGFGYADDWGLETFRGVAPVIERCIEHELPRVFLPQAWGPFERPDVRKAVVSLLGGPNSLFFSRDATSSVHLAEALGLDDAPPARSDIALAFKGADPERGVELLRAMGCSGERPVVGLAPSMRVLERTTRADGSSPYVEALAGLVRHCVDALDSDVVLIANECAPADTGKDDRAVCRLVREATRRPDRCFASHMYISAADMWAIIGRLDYLASSRFHALVFALSQGVPCTAIGWSHKYRELLGAFGLGEESILDGLGDLDGLVASFERGWGRREEDREGVVRTGLQLREDVSRVFDSAAAFLERGGRRGRQ